MASKKGPWFVSFSFSAAEQYGAPLAQLTVHGERVPDGEEVECFLRTRIRAELKRCFTGVEFPLEEPAK